MNDQQRSGVGFFRGLLAVLRGTVHAVGTLLSLFGQRLGGDHTSLTTQGR